jgi:hypothetical protein
MTVQTKKETQPLKPLSGYREGDDLQFYLDNRTNVIWSIVFEFIREDLGEKATDEDCEVELRRLCEPSVRHYKDCNCAICR